MDNALDRMGKKTPNIWREQVIGRYWCRWGDNIKMNIEDTGRDDMDWIRLALDKVLGHILVDTLTNFGIHIRWGIYWLRNYRLLKMGCAPCS
jgi:hypothetical protein